MKIKKKVLSVLLLLLCISFVPSTSIAHTSTKCKKAKNGVHKYYQASLKSATCKKDGRVVTKCRNNCGYSRSQKIYKGHRWTTDIVVDKATCSKKGQSYVMCCDCYAKTHIKVLPKTKHNYVARVVKPASCFATGYKCKYCRTCNAKHPLWKETIPKKAHNYTVKRTTKGMKKYTCKNCRKSYSSLI